MNARIRLYGSIALTALGFSAFLGACGDDSSGSGGSGGSGGDAATSSSKSSGSSGSSGSGSSTSSGGMVGPELKTINKTAFDATKGQLPEGLAVTSDGKTAYVGYAVSGEIVQVSLPSGTVSAFGTVPASTVMLGGLALGIAIDSAGDVYVGTAKVADPAYVPGVYKIAKAGGPATLFASDPAMTFANGLAFDAAGNLFVADSAAGTIFKITPDKTVTKWLESELLKGNATGTCKTGLGFPIGANGIVMTATDVYVANTDQATLVRIPIAAGGAAGTPVEHAKSDATTCLPLKGADGIALDKAGNILVAANAQNALLSVSKDGTKTTTLHAAGFDSPASVAFATVGGVDLALVTNAAFVSAQTPGATPKPGLVSFGPLP
jgi:sugar lactone lactonase YvrE